MQQKQQMRLSHYCQCLLQNSLWENKICMAGSIAVAHRLQFQISIHPKNNTKHFSLSCAPEETRKKTGLEHLMNEMVSIYQLVRLLRENLLSRSYDSLLETLLSERSEVWAWSPHDRWIMSAVLKYFLFSEHAKCVTLKNIKEEIWTLRWQLQCEYLSVLLTSSPRPQLT